jgi:quercetin dioxygenase-like cupin family protein
LSQGSLAVEPGLEIVVTRNAVKPGGTSGWHSHPGGAIVVIQTGQVTTYRKAGESGCAVNTYTAGQSFIEKPGEPLNAKNNGSTETIIYATFPGVPLGPEGTTLQRTDEPNPGTCPV